MIGAFPLWLGPGRDGGNQTQHNTMTTQDYQSELNALRRIHRARGRKAAGDYYIPWALVLGAMLTVAAIVITVSLIP